MPEIPQRRMTTLGSSVAEDQPFEGSPVPWFHIVGRTSLLSDTAGSHSAAPENNECAAQSSRNAAPLPGCEDSSPYKQRGASHSYGVLLRVCRSVVCPSGAFLKVQAKFSAPGIIRPESWTNSPGEPSGRLRNLLVRVSGTQPSLVHDSRSHAPAAFPMVIGISEQTPTRECGGKERFEHRCLRRRGEESGVPCAPLGSVLAGTPVVVGVVGVVLGPLAFDLLARLLRRLHRRRALERLVLRRPAARLLSWFIQIAVVLLFS